MTDFELNSVIEFISEWESFVERTAEKNASEILRQAPNAEAETREDMRGFELRLFERWKVGLDLYDVFTDLARQVGTQRVELLREQDEISYDPVAEVLIANHGRACLIAGEVRALLAAGYPSGAHARWRSLHEIAVISYFVKEHGRDVAQRYIDHDLVQRAQAAFEYQRYAQRLKHDQPYTEKELEQFNASRDEQVQKYGRDFASLNGWATGILGKKRATFADLEAATGLDHLRPYYRMASTDSIHPTFKGTTSNLGLIDGQFPNVLTGASNYGLTDPAHASIISLYQCTVVLVPEFDSDQFEKFARIMITVKVMEKLLDPIANAVLEVQRQIESEEGDLKETDADDSSS